MATKRYRPSTSGFCKKANKVILPDRIAAELLLEHIRTNARRTIHEEKRSYPCLFGNHWHLTSEAQRTENPRLPHSA
jgi:hypothetical protein